ncbi:hypothetical protein ACLBX9_28740 [Methylobacterium sp. A49B]
MTEGAAGKSIATMISIGCARADHHRRRDCIGASFHIDPAEGVKYVDSKPVREHVPATRRLLKH